MYTLKNDAFLILISFQFLLTITFWCFRPYKKSDQWGLKQSIFVAHFAQAAKGHTGKKASGVPKHWKASGMVDELRKQDAPSRSRQAGRWGWFCQDRSLHFFVECLGWCCPALCIPLRDRRKGWTSLKSLWNPLRSTGDTRDLFLLRSEGAGAGISLKPVAVTMGSKQLKHSNGVKSME